jgi:hypothetical protein
VKQPALFEGEADQTDTQKEKRGPGKTPEELVALRQCMRVLSSLAPHKQAAVVQFLSTSHGLGKDW